MNYGIGNIKGGGGGSNNNSISFTRTLEATIGYEDKMCMFFGSDMGDVEEYADKGNDYRIKIEFTTSGTTGQIIYGLGNPTNSSNIPTNLVSLGGRDWFYAGSSSSVNLGFEKFIDEDSVERYALKMLSGSPTYFKLTIAPKYKQNLTGSTKYSKTHIRATLLLWDTEANEYVAYDTGDLVSDETTVGNNTYCSAGNGLMITFETKYALCGVQVKYAYFDNLEVEAQLSY